MESVKPGVHDKNLIRFEQGIGPLLTALIFDKEQDRIDLILDHEIYFQPELV